MNNDINNMDNEEQKNKIAKYGEVIFVIVLIIILVIGRNYKKYKNNVNNKTYETETINEEPVNKEAINEEEQVNNPINDDPTEEENVEEQISDEIIEIKPIYTIYKNINDNIIEKLKKAGFVEDSKNEKCREGYSCFSKGEYFADYKSNLWLEIKKDVTIDTSNKYDPSKDFSLIENIYGIKLSLKNEMKSLMNSFNSIGAFDSFYINMNGIRLHISNYTSELVYSIDEGNTGESASVLLPASIDAMTYSYQKADRYIIIKKIYDVAMVKNSKIFKYYDYVYPHLERNNEKFCEAEFHSKNYEFKLSLCHGGTSDTSFGFGASNKLYTNYDTIKVTYRDDYFGELYEDILNQDLEYFSSKLKTKLELSYDDRTNLINYINNIKDKKKINIKLNSLLNINIEYRDYSTIKNYYITYKIYK